LIFKEEKMLICRRREANLVLAKEKLSEGDVGGATEYFKVCLIFS
jgi:lipoprotein NlpI